MSLGSLPARQGRRKEKARCREPGTWHEEGKPNTNGVGMQAMLSLAKPHPRYVLGLGVLPESWGFVRAKHEVPPKGEASGVCSSPWFCRPRALPGTDCCRHDLAGLCCSLGLLACLAMKTLEQSFSQPSLNEEQSTQRQFPSFPSAVSY